MKISLIAAIAENYAIGRNNQLVWHIKDDLKIFKKTTLNHVVIMGRKSYEAIGKPLPKRTNVVITRNKDYKVEGVLVFGSLKEAYTHFENLGLEEIFVIGGGEIYKQSLQDADIMHISHIHTTVEDADAFFPKVTWEEWECVESQHFEANEGNEFAFDYKLYHKI